MSASKTILFMPESAYGPTNNCIGIGDILRQRGHKVVFAAEASWKGKLEALGFVEGLVHLAPVEEGAEDQDAGQFWKDFIRETAPEFRKSTKDQLETFMAPTWKALVDGARYCEPQLRAILERGSRGQADHAPRGEIAPGPAASVRVDPNDIEVLKGQPVPLNPAAKGIVLGNPVHDHQGARGCVGGRIAQPDAFSCRMGRQTGRASIGGNRWMAGEECIQSDREFQPDLPLSPGFCRLSDVGISRERPLRRHHVGFHRDTGLFDGGVRLDCLCRAMVRQDGERAQEEGRA